MLKPSEFEVMLRAYNQQILDIATEQDVELVDVEKALADAESVRSDICHFTVAGNKQLADLFVDKITSINHQMD